MGGATVSGPLAADIGRVHHARSTRGCHGRAARRIAHATPVRRTQAAPSDPRRRRLCVGRLGGDPGRRHRAACPATAALERDPGDRAGRARFSDRGDHWLDVRCRRGRGGAHRAHGSRRTRACCAACGGAGGIEAGSLRSRPGTRRPGPPHHRRAALRQHERRGRERILQRRHLRGNPRPADYEHAIRMFQKAIAVDSKYALAYARIADACSHLYRYVEASRENVEITGWPVLRAATTKRRRGSTARRRR